MPTNVTPEYERAERRFREAGDDQERLDALREMLRTVPKHKGTDRLQGDIKRRISKLSKATTGKKGAARGPDPFHIPPGGAGQVVLIGPPNVGKSMLVAATTNAAVKVADYPFTTALPVPGMAMYEDVPIELVDTPPVTADHIQGGLASLARLAHVLCIVVDAAAGPLEQADMVLSLLRGRRLEPRSAPRGQLDASDPAARSGLIVANKADLAAPEDLVILRELYADIPLEVRAVSAATGDGLEALLERLWQLLSVLRVYTKQPGRPPDHDKPFTLPIGATIEDLARQIHRELPDKMTRARIWGAARPPAQQVGRHEPLHDKDVVEIHE